jgi:hypothetical protein
MDEWLKFKPITGVGEIVRLGQDVNTNFLHYAGTGAPEKAHFKIDVSQAKDLDKRKSDGLVRDAGLDRKSTKWRVEAAAAGTMPDGKFASTFTPSDTVHSNIKVFAKVGEGHDYSYESGNNDEPVERMWNERLTTFKVGIRIDPGNKVIWEDDNEGSLTVEQNSKSLACRILPRTPIWGEVIKRDKADYPQKAASWTALAASSNGMVDGIQGAIQYTPSIKVVGKYRIYGGLEGFQSIGRDAGKLTVGLAAKVNPYVAAAVKIALKIMSGNKTEWLGRISGEAVIENDKKRQVDELFESREHRLVVDLSQMSVPGNVVRVDKGHVTRGSADIMAMVAVLDNGRLCGAYMKIDRWINGLVRPPGPQAQVSFSTKRPEYVQRDD